MAMSEPARDDRELLREALGPTPQCPPLEALAAQPDAKLLRHVEECPHCRAELALLRQFETGEARPAERADVAWIEADLRRRSPVPAAGGDTFANKLRDWFGFLFSPSGSGKLGLAAVALLVLVMAGIVLRPRSQRSQSEDGGVWRSSQITAISPAGDLEQAPTQLRWEPAAGAASYHVRLFEVDGTEIWAADVTGTSVDFPSNIAAIITPGRAFQWDVAARDSSGRQIASTNSQTFHIAATRR